MSNVSRSYRKWPEVEEILSRYFSSGLTQRAFAKAEGIGCSTLQNYLRRQRKHVTDRQNQSQLAEVELSDSTASEPSNNGGSSQLRYKVWIRNDIALEVPGGFSPKDLTALMRTTVEVFGR